MGEIGASFYLARAIIYDWRVRRFHAPAISCRLREEVYPSDGASNYPQVVAAAISFGAFELKKMSEL